MSDDAHRQPRPDEEVQPARVRKLWEAPQVTDLPRLTDLTLQTGSPIGGIGNTGGGGSTVF